METISFRGFRQYFPFTSSVIEALTGRAARRIYLSLFLIFILVTTVVRTRSYFLARKFQRVLSSLNRLQIDKTSEEELVRSVPYLVRSADEIRSGTHVERYYYLVVSNETDWLMDKLNFGAYDYRVPRGPVLKIAGWFGYRFIGFYAQVLVTDGNVSQIRYEIEDEFTVPAGLSEFVSVRSVHGLWDQDSPTVVRSADDENPQFRVSGDKKSLHVTYVFDASPEQTARAFDINLSCLWSFRGCRTARDIAPHLLQYENEMQEKALSRLASSEPCPDRILAGRVKYLPDLDVLLLDVVRVPKRPSGDERGSVGKVSVGYRLREIIRGSEWESEDANKFRYNPEIQSSSNLSLQSANSSSRVPQLGDRVLLFAGGQFQSCQIIPDTPSALLAIQKAVPVPRHQEDEMSKGRF